MINDMTVTQQDTSQEEKATTVKFTIPENWITSETRMMKRVDHIQSELVELYRRCMMIVTETELLREGIEEVAKTVPTYTILSESEEEKPEFIEDLEQEEEEIKEDQGQRDETNNRMSSRGL
jgi:DNA anti-recombination protein RmuC